MPEYPNSTHLVVPGSAVRQYFEVSLLLMLGTGFFALASTGRLDTVSVAGFSVALLIRLLGYARGARWKLAPRAVTWLAMLYLLFCPFDWWFLAAGPGPLNRMLQTTVHLILFATIVKVFSARSERDYGYLALLSFLMVLAAAVLTISAPYLAIFALYLLFAISTFSSYEIDRSARGSAEAGAEGPAAGSGRARQPIEFSDPGPQSLLEPALLKTAVALAVSIAAVASLLFFLIPRYRGGHLNALGTSETITGFSDTVALGDIGKLSQSDAVLMRVVPEGDPRLFAGTKWRGIGLSSFDGHRWHNRITRLGELVVASQGHFLLPSPTRKVPRRVLRYRVLLAPISAGVLFAAAIPRQIIAPVRVILVDRADTLRPIGTPVSYEVVSETQLPSPRELRRVPDLQDPSVSPLDLALPPLDPRIARLARQVTSADSNNYDRAASIENYLRKNFRYTLDSSSINPNDPIASFLFDAKQGYCEYFAAAMAVMLRSLQIPARLVNGFETGSYNPVGKDYVVRAKDAHSWVEVHFWSYGWVPFDPTPPAPDSRAGLGALSNYLDAANLFWTEWIVNYDFSHQARLAQQIQTGSEQWQARTQRRLRRFERRGTRLAAALEQALIAHRLLSLALLVPVACLVWFLASGWSLGELKWRAAWRFRRLPLQGSAATLAYAQFLRVLQRHGLRKGPAETPQEFAAALRSTPFADAAREFTELYQAARYGNASLPLARLHAAVAALVRSSRRSSPDPTKDYTGKDGNA